MQTNIAPRETATYGVTETRKFTIEANGKAFKALIDGLYSDKIKSVVRELWSNALDSHIMAGCPDRKFRCTLPTVWEPVFSVRDYGVGLSHEDVMVLYTTVFRSTKENTNTQVGKFGLGSKSPFAYVDTFTVTAFDGVEKRSYSAFIGDDYIPQIASMGSEPCDEDRGLEISFPAKANDSHAFQKAVESVLIGFDVPPDIIGLDRLPPAKTVAMEGEGWKLYTDATFDAHARQGCVAYPLNAYAITGITKQQSALLTLPLLIDFPIGELEITTNREALGYNEETIENILKRLDNILATVATTLSATLAACKTMWEARQAYSNMSKAGLNATLLDALRGRMKWREQPLTDFVENRVVAGVSKEALRVTNRSMHDVRRYRRLKWEPSTYGRMYCLSARIYFEDTDVKVQCAAERIRTHATENSAGVNEISWIKGSGKSLAWKRVLVALGRPPFINVSELPKPLPTSNPRSRYAVKMKELHQERLVDTEVVASEGGIFCNMERGEIKWADMTFSTYTLVALRKGLIAAGMIEAAEPIIVVPATHKRMPIANAGWRNIFDIAKQYVVDHIEPQLLADAHAARGCLDSSTNSMTSIFERAEKIGLEYSRSGAFGQAAAYRAGLHKIAADGEAQLAVRKIAELIRYDIPAVEPTISTNYSDAVLTGYPLIAIYIRDCSSYLVNDEDVIKLLNYVNIVDSAKALSLEMAA